MKTRMALSIAAAACVVRRCVAPRTQERLLSHVFGKDRVGDDGAGQPAHLGLVPADEGGRGIRIAHGEAGQEGVVRCGPHGRMLRALHNLAASRHF